MRDVELSLIVAMTLEGVIGNKGELPWYLPSDLAHFKRVTKEVGTIIMGRTTFDSILSRNGRLLPNRKHIVLTRNRFSSLAKRWVFPFEESPRLVESVEEACMEVAAHSGRACVIGGEEIYRLFMPLPQLTKMHVTVVHALNLEGDAYFLTRSEIKKEWICIEKTDVRKWNPGDEHETSVRLYERRE